MARKAMSTEKARQVRQQGHDDALEFARTIEVESDYRNNLKAKKDVIDGNGDTHSVKSGQKRWQIFLYRSSRLQSDDAFLSMNGVGQLLIDCLKVYPEKFTDYQKNKAYYKQKMRPYMRALSEKFQEKRLLRSFLSKAIFNGGEVDYLTVKHEDKFHIFHSKDVVTALSDHFIVENSKARKPKDIPEQKVLFKYNNRNVGELEIRKSSKSHFREILFVINKLRAIELLFSTIEKASHFHDKVILYGGAIKKFNTQKRIFNR